MRRYRTSAAVRTPFISNTPICLLAPLVSQIDTDGNHTVEWDEFCKMMHNIRNGQGAQALGQVVKKAAKMFNVEGAGGATHTFSEEEVRRLRGHNITTHD